MIFSLSVSFDIEQEWWTIVLIKLILHLKGQNERSGNWESQTWSSPAIVVVKRDHKE